MANEPLQGSVEYKSPFEEREASVGALPGNFAQDVESLASGIAALGALPIARGLEAAQEQMPLTGKENVFENLGKLTGGLGLATLHPYGKQSLVRPTDFPEALHAGKDIVDYYVNEYGKPYLKANEKASMPEMLGTEAQNLGEHFLKAPLQTAMDILPEKVLFGSASKLMNKPMANLTAKIRSRFPVMPKWFEAEHMPEWLKHIHAENEQTNLVENKLKTVDQAMRDKMMATKIEMDNAFHAVPDEMKPYLPAALEVTDPDIYKNISGHPAVKNLQGKVLKFNRIMEERLKIPDPINLRTKYGGILMQRLEAARQTKLQRLAREYPNASPGRQEAILAQIKDAQPLKFGDLRQPKYMRLLKQLRAGWEKEHAPPIYAGIVNAVALKRAMSDLITKPLGKEGEFATSKSAKLAKQMVKEGLSSPFEANPENMPGFLQARLMARVIKTRPTLTPLSKAVTEQVLTIRNAKHSHNINDLTQLRMFELYRLQAIYDFMNSLKEMGNIEKPGWVQVNLKDEFTKLIKDTGAQNMPNFKEDANIFVPEKVAKKIQEIIHGKTGEISPAAWNRIHFLTNLRNQVAYTLNPVFKFWLAVQTGASEVLSWNTPKDILTSVVSHIIANDPRASDILPGHLLLSQELRMPVELLTSGTNLQKSWALAKWKQGKSAWEGHETQRRAMAISFLLNNAKNAPPSIRQLIGHAMNVTATLELLEKAPFNGKLIEALQDHIKSYLGDYSSAAAYKTFFGIPFRQLLKFYFSVPGWLGHTAKSIRTLPLKHPIKTSLLGQLALVAHKELQPETEPEAFKKMGLIPTGKPDKFGHQSYVGSPGMIVWLGGLEMIEAATNIIAAPSERVDLPSGIAPTYAIPTETIFKFDVRSRKPFVEESPDLKPGGKLKKRYGNFYMQKDYTKHINESGKEVKQTSPGLPLIFLENEFPTLMKPLQQIAARGKKTGKFYEPTRFTWFGHPARKSFKGQPVGMPKEAFWLGLLGIPMKQD